MTKPTPARVTALARAVAAESRCQREAAAVERRFGRLRFPDDITMDQARAAFGPLIDALARVAPLRGRRAARSQ